MTGSVKLTITAAMTAIATAQVVGGFAVTLTDSAGNTQTQAPQASAFPAPDASGNFSLDITFTGVPTGGFNGSVQAVDTTGANVGAAVSFSGVAQNLQPIPTSVTVSLG